MPKPYTLFCSALVVLLLIANWQGILYSDYLSSNNSQANKSANRFHK